MVYFIDFFGCGTLVLFINILARDVNRRSVGKLKEYSGSVQLNKTIIPTKVNNIKIIRLPI